MGHVDRSIELVVRMVWIKVWKHKLVFIATSGGLFALAILTMLTLQPIYEGATFLISGQESLEQLPDGSRKPAETAAALARIAESEEVVGDAIEKIGLAQLTPALQPDRVSIFTRLRRMVVRTRMEAPLRRTPLDAAIPQVKLNLRVHTETSSDVISIAYRNKDPVLAARFANAVAQAFIDRHILLYSRPGAADFFMRQQERFQHEAKAASDELEALSTQTEIYSLTDQKSLLLKRESDLESALALTRGLIIQQSGERRALAASLHQLAPVARSHYVSALVDTLSGGQTPAPSGTADPRVLLEREADPPLLLIKVYQDSMVTLFKTNADLEGEQSIEKEQIAEIAKIKSALDAMTRKEQDFTRLMRTVSSATYNADVYGKRMVEEQINAESNAERFTSLKVIQKATVPLRPVTPNYPLVTLAAALGSALAGLGAALLMSRRA